APLSHGAHPPLPSAAPRHADDHSGARLAELPAFALALHGPAPPNSSGTRHGLPPPVPGTTGRRHDERRRVPIPVGTAVPVVPLATPSPVPPARREVSRRRCRGGGR